VNLELEYRRIVAERLNAAQESGAKLTWSEWKDLFYFYRYDRNIGMLNETAFGLEEFQYYFQEPPISALE